MSLSSAATNLSTPLLASATAHPVPAGFLADASLLVHDMPGITGARVRASTLLFVPRGAPPAGGWPLVAWAHGTSTAGLKTCAPSLTPDLDGGLTRDGFASEYAFQIGSLVNAGYAVAAPDFEGLGAAAESPYPYFSAASLARSLVAGVRAAREAQEGLSHRWAAVGHSEGGHAVLCIEPYADEAAGLDLLALVAIAPYTSVAATVAGFNERARTAPKEEMAFAARKMAQYHVAMMAVGLTVQAPDFDPASVMGADLLHVLPAFRTACLAGALDALDKAMKEKGEGFAGLLPEWDKQVRMAAFLAANDPAAMPGFSLHRPSLIVQGMADRVVLEPLTTAFADSLRSHGAPVTYTRYPDADHASIFRAAEKDVLPFLKKAFSA